MQVRRASADDEPTLRVLWDEFNAEATYTPYPGPAFSASLLAEHHAFLAEEAGAPVGCVQAATPSGHVGFVFGLYVRPAARQRGLGRRLMRAVAEALRDDGREYVVLSVDTPNLVARSLYERLGFLDAARTLRVRVDDLLEQG